MTQAFTLEIDAPPAPAERCDLRTAVGWARNEADYPAAFAGHRAIVSAHASGFAIVHVDFTPANEAFDRACGFRIGLAGILETVQR